MAYTFREAIKTAYKYLEIDESKVKVIGETNGRGIVYDFDGNEAVLFIYPISCKQNNKQNFFDTRDSGAKERKIAWEYAQKNGLRYFCFGFNEEQDRYKDYVLSLESDENAISNISFRKSEFTESTGTQVNIPNDFIPSKRFERIRTPKGFYISAIQKDAIHSYIELFDNRPYMIRANEENPEEQNKRLFSYWMKAQVRPEGDLDAGQPYSELTIDQYVNDISKVNLPMMPEKSVFYTSNIGEIEITINQLSLREDEYSQQISAVKKYLEYLVDTEEVDYDDVMQHNLWGIHIKNKNTALSEENPHVCIGWSAMGDLSGLETTEDIVALYERHFDKNNRAKGQDVGMIRRFLKDVQVGDYIIYAEASEFHIGRIESEYYYDDTYYQEQDSDYKNNRKVKWLKTNIDRKIISTAMHNSLATAMSIFGINDYRAAVVDLLNGTYKKDDEAIGGVNESLDLVFHTSVDVPYERNRIVFGAPGTGKSFCLKTDSNKIVADYYGKFERVTFHPDYTYSQFVGTYKPVMDENGEKIKYEYVPGPFMRVLTDALRGAIEKDGKPYLLLIEEINRAKVAAVFGEVFQLLDRDEEGISEYDIQPSEDMKRYLVAEIGGNVSDYERIKIPNNMYIWATMNSADQGVFPMDTAFKRRWNFEYIGIDAGQEKMSDGKAVLGKDAHSLEVSWNKLRKTINDLLATDYKVNEDKLMGPFFLAKRVTESDENGNMINSEEFIKVFKSKVIMYLYEDAAKQHKHKLFSGCDSTKYSSVCDAFESIGVEIFGDTFVERYNNQKG